MSSAASARARGRRLGGLAVAFGVLAIGVGLGLALLRGGREPADVAPAAAGGGRTSVDAAPLDGDFGARARLSPSEPAGPPVRVTVRTRTGLVFSDRQPVPGVGVAVGSGSPYDPASPVLARGVTGDDGDATLALPGDAPAALWARVDEPGWQRRTRSLRLRQGVGEIELLAARGGVVIGRLLDAGGAPLPGRVDCLPSGGRVGPSGRANAGEDGWFELDLATGGRGNLLAEATDRAGAVADPIAVLAAGPPETTIVGTAGRRGVDLRLGDPPQRIELVVGGPGVLRGRVVDASGRPLDGLTVDALVADLDPTRFWDLSVPRPEPWRDVAFDGQGRIEATVRTTAEGTFELRGLRRGLFHVRAWSGSSVRFPRIHVLTATPVPSDGEPLELVYPGPCLVVHLVDAAGAPWTGEARIARGAPVSRIASVDWSDVPEVAVVAVADEVLRDLSLDYDGLSAAYVEGEPTSDGGFFFELPAERRFWLGLRRLGQAWRPIEVAIPAGASRVERTLAVVDDALDGTLVVSAFDAAGAPCTRAQVRVEDPDTGVPVASFEPYFDGWPLRVQVPSGTWRVIVEGAAATDFWHGQLQAPRDTGAFEARVPIFPGVETPLEARLSAGARVAVRIVGTPAVEERSPAGDDLDPLARRREYERTHRVELSLHRPGRWPIPVAFQIEEHEGWSSDGLHLRSSLELGESRTSELLPAGSYTLRGRIGDGRVAEVSVELVDGRTAEAELVFR